jgi:uncharacterized phage protein (TIGR01671 family)
MRTIKFRAWNKKDKKMLFPDSRICETTAHLGLLDFGETIEFGTHEEWNRYELMQFTGLYDRHGKEIYEGDIVEWETDIDRDYYNGPHRFIREEVKFEGGAFYPVCSIDEYEFEVIGNIYENPELLKI